MIITLLNNMLFGLVKVLTAAIDIPTLPEGVQSVMSSLLDCINTGVAILANYTHLSYLLSLFSVIIAVDLGLTVYHFVLFVVKKIPMLGIK